LTIFWIATTVNGEQRLLSASDDGPIPTALDKAAQVYGLPIILPILDLNDLNQLSVTDVVGRFVAPVVQASVRYGSNAVVMINIDQKNNQWTSLWTLVTDNAPQSWSVQGTDVNQVVADGMSKLVGMLSQQFALKGTSQHTTVNIQINGIASISDYARANRYLQRLAAFQLGLSSDSASLQKAIALDPTLTSLNKPATITVNATPELPVPLASSGTHAAKTVSGAAQNSAIETLVYQWTP